MLINKMVKRNIIYLEMDGNLLHRRAHLNRLLPVRLISNNTPGNIRVNS